MYLCSSTVVTAVIMNNSFKDDRLWVRIYVFCPLIYAWVFPCISQAAQETVDVVDVEVIKNEKMTITVDPQRQQHCLTSLRLRCLRPRKVDPDFF